MVHHIPVLLGAVEEQLKGLDKDILVVDCTLGRGGHFLALLKYFNKMVGCDADSESIEFVKSSLLKIGFTIDDTGYLVLNTKKVLLTNQNFTDINNFLTKKNLNPNVLLADLGISMHHIKESKRGFSFLQLDEPLDMRIDTVNNFVTASTLLNVLSLKDIEKLLLNLGQEYRAKTYAKQIVSYREKKRILTVSDLLLALKIDSSRKYKIHPATKVFMALRIAVNSEHLNLKQFLNSLIQRLHNSLILLVITFHSLEEKCVENFCKENNFNFKKISPLEEEIKNNKSSRSAKLYVIKNV